MHCNNWSVSEMGALFNRIVLSRFIVMSYGGFSQFTVYKEWNWNVYVYMCTLLNKYNFSMHTWNWFFLFLSFNSRGSISLTGAKMTHTHTHFLSLNTMSLKWHDQMPMQTRFIICPLLKWKWGILIYFWLSIVKILVSTWNLEYNLSFKS